MLEKHFMGIEKLLKAQFNLKRDLFTNLDGALKIIAHHGMGTLL